MSYTPNFSEEIRKQTLHNNNPPKENTPNEKKVENKTTDWQRFSVICDKKLIVKLRRQGAPGFFRG